MKKLKLDLDDLKVESFKIPTSQIIKKGTVQGNIETIESQCYEETKVDCSLNCTYTLKYCTEIFNCF